MFNLGQIVSPWYCALQDRAKGPARKRPPTRHNYSRGGSSSSDSVSASPGLLGSKSPGLPSPLDKTIPEVDNNDLFGASSPQMPGIAIDKDLFSANAMPLPTSKQNGGFNEDLFADNKKPSKSKKKEESVRPTGPKSQSQPTPTVSVFDNPPEDIFASPPGKTSSDPDDIFAPGKVDSGLDSKSKLDSFLSSTSVPKKGIKGKSQPDGGKVRIILAIKKCYIVVVVRKRYPILLVIHLPLP